MVPLLMIVAALELEIVVCPESVMPLPMVSEPVPPTAPKIVPPLRATVAVPGVTIASFLRSAVNATRKARNGGVESPMPVPEFRKELLAQMDRLKVSRELASRYLNDGFSGGEKKRVEILQMAMLRPKIAVLDETDSGLDIDALRIVSEGVNTLAGPEMGVLVITHYARLLHYIKPDVIHVLVDGRIARTGGPELADELERDGYAAFGVDEEAVPVG